MKTFASIIVLILSCVPTFGQNNDKQEHGQVGVFGEYFRFQGLDANLAGLGGRLSINVRNHLQLEGEMSYLF
ncbi:MAG TPA: hypothetical protein VNR20_07510, partial [Terriglobales bacterium]|nr:hypothetical protein [Terriglobales bacterium]